MRPTPLDETVRVLAPSVLGALVRRYGSFADCEDAVQHALVSASEQWPQDGIPRDPRAWLMTVARRRYVDIARASRAREQRERLHSARRGRTGTVRLRTSTSPAPATMTTC
jgi:predicted RNA polymerase sigma factor